MIAVTSVPELRCAEHLAEEQPVRPALILPFHDPSGRLLELITSITPALKHAFTSAFLCVSPATERLFALQLMRLQADPFFVLNTNAPDSLPGDHYRAAFASALHHSTADQVLLMCDFDKLAAVMHSTYRARFFADLEASNPVLGPVLFQRSPQAWRSYPQPYRDIEQAAITLGAYLFERYLDWAWSYLLITHTQLQAIMPQLRLRDFGLLGEIVLVLLDTLRTQDVDWLFWEDPFVERRDAGELRSERAASASETRKRLKMNAPILRLLLERIDGLV